MRRHRDDRRELGAARRHFLDEIGEEAREADKVARLRESAGAADVGMSDQEARRAACFLMRGEKPAIIMHRGARPEPTDQAEAAAGRAAHVSEIEPTWSWKALRLAIASYQRSRCGVGGRSGTSWR